MKRFKIWVKELTLTQQLLTIIFLFVTLFVGFFFFYFNSNINSFVEDQMYIVLERTQDSLELSYDNGVIPNIVKYEDKFVSSAVIGNEVAYFSKSFNSLPKEVFDRIIKDSQEQAAKVYNYDTEIGGIRYLYRVTVLKDNTRLISLINHIYQEQFRTTLSNTVINVLLIVVTLLFILLMLWVTYLIHSLNLIRIYIDKVRKNEEATLTLDRKDEIGEVANALVVMKAEIKRQEQIKEELIQNISHDLKTPIATIKSYGESIKDGVYPYETLEKSVDVIIEHANRLEKKVQSLLLLNRMGYLVTTQEAKEVDMYEIVEKTLLSIKVIRPDIKIITNLEHIQFTGNEEPWRVVLENLLDNAMRYAKTTITINLNEKELSIENDGSQLSKERQEKLFKPYEKGSDGQFGLGLSIVHRVISAYDYKVYAENTRNGVIFRIVKKNKIKSKEITKVKISKSKHKNDIK